MSLLDYRHW